MPLAPAIRIGAGARGPSTGSFSKDAAPGTSPVGIPDMYNYGKPTERLTPGQLVKFVLQLHDTARKPGRPHYDLRLGTPDTGLFSWAVPKASLPEPGEKRLAPQTQVHSYGYGDFTGRIGRGYGQGTVTMADNGKALITKVTPNTINFTVAHARRPRRFTLIKIPQERLKSNDPQWLLVGIPVGRKDVPGIGEKPTYKLLRATDMDDAMEQATQIQAKIDGAHGVYDIDEKGRLEAYSVNPSVTGEPIVHTERLGLAGVKIPKLRNTTFRGEMFATDSTGKAVSFNELSGLLNANISTSLEEQRKRQLATRNALFGVVRSKGVPFTGTPDEERTTLEGMIQYLPKDQFMLPEAASTPEEKRTLLEAIRSGQYPATREGVILHVGDKRTKFKLRPETTLYLRGTYPGEGKRSQTAGGLLAGHDPDKPGQIRLGTGFSDAQLADIVKNLPDYLNRPVRVEHQGRFETGLLRAPSFKGFETDKPLAKAAEDHPLAALFASIGVPIAAQSIATTSVRKALERTPVLEPERIPDVLGGVDGVNPKLVVKPLPNFDNAAFVQPGREIEKNPVLSALFAEDPMTRERAKRHGLIVYDPKLLHAGLLAHEGGHARIEHEGGIGRFNQRYLRRIGQVLDIPASMVAYTLASMKGLGPLASAGLVGGTGALFTLPTLLNEVHATRHANRYLDESSHKTRTKEQNRAALRRALLTYITAGTIAPAAGAAAYAALRGRNKTAQWQPPVFTGHTPPVLPKSNLQQRLNVYWAPKIYREPEPATMPKKVEEPKKDFYINVNTPDGKTVRVNASLLSRDLGIAPESDPGKGPYLLPEKIRIQLQQRLAKVRDLNKAVERVSDVAQDTNAVHALQSLVGGNTNT